MIMKFCHIGPYDTNTTMGACLWVGENWESGDDPATAGWLNGCVFKLSSPSFTPSKLTSYYYYVFI